jgi:hypothetical protein
MNINVERFLALTAMLAAPLVAAPGCIIAGDDDDTNGTASASNTNAGTEGTGTETSATSPATTVGENTIGDTTVGESTAGESTAGESTAGESTAGESTTGGIDLGNCCDPKNGGLGCEVTDVSDCVCAEDPACCEEGWDMYCVAEVNQFECGTCDLPAMPWDCYCTADCDGEAVATPWQVCGSDDVDAAANGQAACEADLGGMCTQSSCAECICSTAEIPEIEC